MDTPLVSIILTTLNSERFLTRSIDSCLEQTYSNLELLVVDGGSTDRTLDIIATYNDPRIRVIHQQDNAGKLPGALNLGMASASGEFITWTQDDCWYVINAIQMMVEYLQTHPAVALVYSDFWLVDCIQRQVLYREVNTPEYILEEDVVQQCFLFRRLVYETVGPQDERYYSVHEIPWRIKVAKQFRMAPLHVPLQYYMLHSGSLTGRFGGYNEQRKIVRAVRSEGHIGQRESIRRLAAIDIHQGYEAFVRNGDYGLSRRYLVAGIAKDWRWIGNIGLWKMIGLSWLPQRKPYRNNLYDQWQAKVSQEQTILFEKYRPAEPTVPEEMFDA
jgi:glycosyltransferase involved in cell wall biosynthesis